MSDFYKYNESYSDKVQELRHNLIRGKIKPEEFVSKLLEIDYVKAPTESMTLSVELSLFAPAGKNKASLASLEVDDWGGVTVDEAVLKEYTLARLKKRLQEATHVLVAFREALQDISMLRGTDIEFGLDEQLKIGERVIMNIMRQMNV